MTTTTALRAALLLVLFGTTIHGCSVPGPPPPPPGAIPSGQSIGSAEISGRAHFQGAIPPREEIDMASDAVCHAKGGGAIREDVVVGADGALKNVFVHVVSGLGSRVFAPPASSVVLDQRGCSYHPHVLGIQVNQMLEIVNSDPTLHNIHSVPATNKPFNVGMPAEGMRIRRFFAEPESMVKLKCDLHNWMIAWVGVTPHPFFAVSGDDGSFTIRGLPAGAYEIEAWHEVFGVRSVKVTLGDGEKRSLPVEFGS
ncbi:MAG: hypothetical protein HY049_07310 [Acidobacteria bacterium]|nr:hypothetical protein [Acidobacteriota bacterium]